jgi:hypothetical protein
VKQQEESIMNDLEESIIKIVLRGNNSVKSKKYS